MSKKAISDEYAALKAATNKAAQELKEYETKNKVIKMTFSRHTLVLSGSEQYGGTFFNPRANKMELSHLIYCVSEELMTFNEAVAWAKSKKYTLPTVKQSASIFSNSIQPIAATLAWTSELSEALGSHVIAFDYANCRPQTCYDREKLTAIGVRLRALQGNFNEPIIN